MELSTPAAGSELLKALSSVSRIAVADAALHRRWLFRVASSPAVERIAHFLCEINLRLMAIGQSDGRQFGLQLTQAEVGEICGITSIHTNRVLRELREKGLCKLHGNVFEIHDLGRLMGVARFCPDYLYYDAALRDAFNAIAGEPPP